MRAITNRLVSISKKIIERYEGKHVCRYRNITIYVLAGSYEHFLHWRRTNELSARSGVRYVNSVRDIVGIDPHFSVFILYDTWRAHPQHKELLDYVMTIEARSNVPILRAAA